MKYRYLSLLILTPLGLLFGKPANDFTLRVDVTSIVESGFVKIVEEKFPMAKMMFMQAESDEDFKEFTRLTGIKLKDIRSLEISATGLEKIMEAEAEGRDPLVGSEVGFVAEVTTNNDVDFDALLKLMMVSLENQEGPEARKKVEASRKSNGGTTYLTLPKELMGEPNIDTDILMAMSKLSGGKGSALLVGVPSQVMARQKGEKVGSFICLDAMAKDRQVTFALRIPPSVWERPEMKFDQQNPLFAGLANAVKGIRELGISVSFRKETLGLEICLNCVDTQSALGLWTVAQGGLGMAQLAASQEGAQVPAILNRIKTQALEKNVLVKVEVLPSDLNEFAGMAGLGEPESADVAESPIPKRDSDSLVGMAAPSVNSKFLDGGDFDLSKHKGKVVVLDFWATWCGPCVRALPELMKATSSFPKNQVALIAVNQGEKAKQIKKFLKQKKWESLSVVLDPQSLAGKSFKVKGIPQTVIIDKQGKIRHVHVGFSPNIGSRLKKEIEALVSE
jgi:thiol-disulfide isomerase/thioredoxin